MNYGIVFIETRPLPNLRLAFERHLPFVPQLKPMVICSARNQEQFNGYDKIIVPNPGSHPLYNRMITNAEFWKQIPFDKALVCEHDSGILREGIEEFYQWDWVGAPWKFQKHGGNGGFSWRNIAALTDLCKRFRYGGGENEDVFFCNCMKLTNWKLAPRNVCERFSVETIFRLGTFGYHAIKSHFGPTEVDMILNQYSEIIR